MCLTQRLGQPGNLDLQLFFPRDEGPNLPTAKAASKNSAFHHPIDYSPTLSRRAASAMSTSPANTLNTIQFLSSIGIEDGLPKLRLSFRNLHNSPATYSDAQQQRRINYPPCPTTKKQALCRSALSPPPWVWPRGRLRSHPADDEDRSRSGGHGKGAGVTGWRWRVDDSSVGSPGRRAD